MGAGPIFLEWSDVISRGYDWGFPQVNSFLAHISKYKHRAKNYKDVADSSQCEDLDGVKEHEDIYFRLSADSWRSKEHITALIFSSGRSHEYAEAQTSHSYHHYLSGINARDEWVKLDKHWS